MKLPLKSKHQLLLFLCFFLGFKYALATIPLTASAYETSTNGIKYNYYEGSWRVLPDFSQLNSKKSGTLLNFSLEPREQEDFFAFAFDAMIQIDTEGEYTFYTNSNDGSKLFINDRMIVDNDGLHGSREKSGKISLSPGLHPIRVEFFQGRYGKDLKVNYEGPGISKRLIPSSKLFIGSEPESSPQASQDGDSNGINYGYYEGSWRTLPDFSQLTAKKSGTLSNFSLGPREQEDYFGFAYDAYIQIDTDGEYTFFTNSNDGSKLYINNRLIVDNDGLHGSREKSGMITLSQGRHNIRVTFFQGQYGKDLKVYYQGPGILKQQIPTSQLYLKNASQPTEPTESTSGVTYQYYEGQWQMLPDFSRLTPLKSGTMPNFSLSPREQEDYFGFRYDAHIQIDAAGEYTFFTNSNDGSKLYINNRLIVDNDGLHGSRERSGKITLSQGKHAIRVTFFQGKYGKDLKVYYQGPGLSKRQIPGTKLTTGDSSPPNDGYTPRIFNMSANSTSVEHGQQISFSWDEQDILVQGYGFQLDLFQSTGFVRTIASGINTKSYTWNMPESVTPGTYTMRVSSGSIPNVSSTSDEFVVEESISSPGVPLDPDVGLISAVIPGDRTNVLELTFSDKLNNVTTDDFFTNKTHALIKAKKMTGALSAGDSVQQRTNSNGTYTYVLQLSDHVVPGETPEIVYYQERSDITNASGRKIASIEFAPVNVSEVSSYNGSKKLITITKNDTWNDVINAMDDNTIIRIQRGFVDKAEPRYIYNNNLTLTAYGSGDKPKITFSGSGWFCLGAINKNYLSFVGLHIVSNGVNGLVFRDRSSYASVIDCTLERIDNNSSAQAAIDFFHQSDNPNGYTRLEGPKALFNKILNHNGGIFFNLSKIARYEWKQRYVEDRNNDGYRQPAMIVGNYIKLKNHGSDKGDAIAVSRGDHNWAEVSYNLVEGWVDDGFDAFQAQRVIVEFNTWDQQLSSIASKGGNAIKAGGIDMSDNDRSNYTSGYSGDIIVRYNVIKNTITSGGRNQFGINTNKGGHANGRTNWNLGITYGKTLIYGNIIYNTRRNAMQIWGADGRDFEIYNNLFISRDEMGVRFSAGTNIDKLIFKNNIVSNAQATDNIPGQYNIWLEDYKSSNAHELNSTEKRASLSSIFINPANLSESDIRAGSPTVDAGNSTDLGYKVDIRGQLVGTTVDVGPIEFGSASQTNSRLSHQTKGQIREEVLTDQDFSQKSERQFRVFPVPFENELTVIKNPSEKSLNLQLLDLKGSVLLEKEIAAEATEIKIDTSGQSIRPGQYVMIIRQGEQLIKSVNLLKH